MLEMKRLAVILAAALLWVGASPAEARTKKGDQFYSQGQQAEQRRDYETAFGAYEKALAEDPGDVVYQMALRRMRFQVGQAHVDRGETLRAEGKLEEALLEFRQAFEIDPASPIAVQEIRRTMLMIGQQKDLKSPLPPEVRGLTPAEHARRETDQRLASVMAVPQLKPLSPAPMTFKANNQPPRVIIETICKLAGINPIFDPDAQVQAQFRSPAMSVEWTNITIEEALNFIATQARLFWKPISQNAVFITADNPNKRREVEETVTKVLYINNVSAQNDLTEIRTTVQQMTGVQRVAVSQAQNAIIIRGTADQVALAEILVRNLDRPKAEVVVDVVLLEASRSSSQTLTAALSSAGGTGISIPITYTPRGAAANSSGTRLNQLSRTSSADFSVVLPGGLLEALMKDGSVKILQSPQVRAVDGMKATLKVGDRVPYSTGGFQPAFGQVGGTGFSSLYNQFQFIDTGVTVDITPKIHGSDEVTLHVELTVSSVKERIEIAGISQPVVGNRNIVHDIRLREGEVNLLGGLVQSQETKTISGIPGLSNIPVVRRLFTGEKIERSESELLIALIPRIIRTPDLDELSFKTVAIGSEASAPRLTYAPRRAAEGGALPGAAAAATALPSTPAEPPKPLGPPAAMFAPATVETQAGGRVTVDLKVENAADLFSAPVQLKFDPNVLQLEDVTRGGFLVGDGREAIFTRNIQNTTGDVKVMLRRMPGMGGISGSGTLVTLTFQVVGQGVTTVSAPNLTLQDSGGQTILTASPQATIAIK